MKINKLTINQINQLKQQYLIEKNENVSYLDLVQSEDTVSTKELFNHYKEYDFVEEDFS